MKKIEAVIQTCKLREVIEALERIGVISLFAREVEGRGRQGGITEEWEGELVRMDTLFKVKLEAVVANSHVEKVIDTMLRFARAGYTGDGKIFIYPVKDVIRIRTGEHGREAL